MWFALSVLLVVSGCGRSDSSIDSVKSTATAPAPELAVSPAQEAASAAEMAAAAAKMMEIADAHDAKQGKHQAPAPTSAWSYEETKDAMTDAITRTASIVSDNSLQLDFPYQGHNPGTIVVRQHARHGLDVIVYVNKGQVLCLVTGCSVTVRFDDGKAMRFSANGPADHSAETVFLTNRNGFIAGARKAKRIRVILPIYQAGDQVLEFTSPVPLEWATAKKKQR